MCLFCCIVPEVIFSLVFYVSFATGGVNRERVCVGYSYLGYVFVSDRGAS